MGGEAKKATGSLNFGLSKDFLLVRNFPSENTEFAAKILHAKVILKSRIKFRAPTIYVPLNFSLLTNCLLVRKVPSKTTKFVAKPPPFKVI